MTDLIFILWNLSIILESLPISSSGHLKLIAQYLTIINNFSITIDTATEHLMHIPNALIITLLLLKYTPTYLTLSLPTIMPYFIAIVIVNTMTGITYLTVKKHFAHLPLAFGFALSALTLLSLYWAPLSSATTLSFKTALILGCAQSFALLPGVSRMGITTVTGFWLGLHPGASFLFSLACELVLIGIAVITALGKTPVPSLSRKQLAFIILSTLISYAALELALHSFITGAAVFFGWYLLGVSVYALLSSASKESAFLSNK